MSTDGLVAIEAAVAATAATVAAWLTWRIARDSTAVTYTMSRAKIVGKITWDEATGDAFLVLVNYGGVAAHLKLGALHPLEHNPFYLYDQNALVHNGIPYLGDHEEITIRIGRNVSAGALEHWSATD